jgi:MoaA/NifB/PqqE/SkfB family radical SAM enzyme
MKKYLGIAQNVLFKPITVPTLSSHAQIEITSFCNLDCVFCPRRHLVGAPKHMPLDQFKNIFDQILPSNINLSGQGEPLLHPNIPDIIRYCREGGAAVNFPTNLTVPKSLMTEIVEAQPNLLKISIDAASPETYLKIRRKDCFQQHTWKY